MSLLGLTDRLRDYLERGAIEYITNVTLERRRTLASMPLQLQGT
jgi:hypothetical protein